MKTMIRYIYVILILLLIYQQGLKTQVQNDDIIFKAMNDELNRNISYLVLGNYDHPFFISYQLCDAHSLTIKASLGGIRYSIERPGRSPYVRLMVGDYSLNDENFISGNQIPFSTGRSYLSLPLDNDYNAIRRSFWIMSDQVYKSAIQNYEEKLTALKQQNKTDEERIDDYSKTSPVNMVLNVNPIEYDKIQWENNAKEISRIFITYGQIQTSSVNVIIENAIVYITNSEGTKLRIPLSIACVIVNVGTQAEDGEQLNDHLFYYALAPDKLPPIDKIKQDSKIMADYLVALCKAPAIKDSYSGPIIFEGDAIAELCAQKLFRKNGLIASREPIYAVENQNQGSVNKFDNKIDQRICSENITIKAVPKIKSFNNIPLIGSFEIDAEGIIPKDELVLVDKGILKTLLNDRVPTAKIKESNGYCRLGLRGSVVNSQKAPGVINIFYNNGESIESVRTNVLKEAEKDGLEYIYVIRKLEVSNSGMSKSSDYQMSGMRLPISKPIGVYKVLVKTGEECLIRSAVISDFPISAFKQISHGTKDQYVYNTMLNSSIPVSFIVPQALVFNDINIEKDKTVKAKLPIVPNPILIQK